MLVLATQRDAALARGQKVDNFGRPLDDAAKDDVTTHTRSPLPRAATPRMGKRSSPHHAGGPVTYDCTPLPLSLACSPSM